MNIITTPFHKASPNGQTHETKVHKLPWKPFDEGSTDAGLSGLAGMMCRLRASVTQKVKNMHLPAKMDKPCPGMLERLRQSGADITSMGQLEDPFSGDDAKNLRHFIKGGPNKFKPFKPHAHHSDALEKELRGHHHGFNGHHWHRHSFVHAFARALRSFVLAFVVPVLIGVIAGMTASLLGMVVGTMIAWVWVKFVRGGRRGSAGGRIAIVEEDEVLAGEKDELMLEIAPVYEEVEGPPIYVEKE